MKRPWSWMLSPLALAACQATETTERTLSSFEITISSKVGTPDHRCLLPGSSTTGIDLSNCPIYERDAAGNTVARVEFTARALDNFGQLLETYDSVASARVVPGRVDPAFRQLRFNQGVAEGKGGNLPSVAFRGAFGDTFIWLEDKSPPARSTEVPGMGTPCDYRAPEVCAPFVSLGCVDTKAAIDFDPQGLAYCTKACAEDAECPGGYRCEGGLTSYAPQTVPGDRACVRTQPSYAAGAAGPVHFVDPNLTDVSRSDSLVSSPFMEDFVDVKRGNLVVTAVRIDGFYVTDTCPIRGYRSKGQELCTPEELQQPYGFNHLFVFNFSRPDDLFPGDRLIHVSGPVTEFNGLTELGFPLWEVDYNRSPEPMPEAIDLHKAISGFFPELVAPRGRCLGAGPDPERTALIRCDFAMERLEAARIIAKVKATLPITPGSREETNLDRFGQWPVTVDDGTQAGREFQLITRENIPFFDPKAFGAKAVGQLITGNLRQVAFDDRSEPLWIIEPRDQADCPWCKN